MSIHEGAFALSTDNSERVAIRAQQIADDLRDEILAMAATIEAQQKRIGELESGFSMVSERLVAENHNSGKQIERIRELEAVAATCSPYVRGVLYAFYRAPISMSSVQPVLDLAVELNPSLKETR